MMELTARWLQTLDPDRLAVLLARRFEVTSPAPKSLSTLAERLGHPTTVLPALRRLDQPTLDVCEVIVALGGDTTRAEVGRLLGATAPPADVDRAIARLVELALARVDQDRISVPRAVRRAWMFPLGLGPSAATIIEHTDVETLHRICKRLGVPAEPRRAGLERAVIAALRDRDLVRSTVDSASPEAATLLRRMAASGEHIEAYGYRPRSAEHDPFDWAANRGLIMRSSMWDDRWILPGEVALALQETNLVARFEPTPPVSPRADADPAVVERDAAAAGGNFLRLASAILDSASRVPIAMLRDGGIGVRELKRLAKAHGVTPDEARLAVALAHHARLLTASGGASTPTAAYDAWLDREPADRLALLIHTWWSLTYPVLSPPAAAWTPGLVDGADDLRATLLEVIAAAPGAIVDAVKLLDLVIWHRPSAILAPQEEWVAAVAASLYEAAILGLLGNGAISPAGRALLADDATALTAALAGVGQVVRTAHLQTDLTAVVTGTPSPRLAEVLDVAADRESSATAATWRFSPASVRRALDAGLSADEVLGDLKEIAANAVPQALEYLVHDVARRHGAVRASAVACCLRGDDTALLAEMVADRRLRGLGLRSLAPTVVTSMRPVDETLAALRNAGYAPVAEGADGTALVEQRERRRAEPGRDVYPDRGDGPRALAARRRAANGSVTPTPAIRRLAAALLAQPRPPEAERAEVEYPPPYFLDVTVIERPPPPRRPLFPGRRW